MRPSSSLSSSLFKKDLPETGRSVPFDNGSQNCPMVWVEIFGTAFVLGGFMLIYVFYFLVVGYVKSIRPVCPAGYRAISVDGSRSLMPIDDKDIIVPNADYPTCSPVLSCPAEGQKWAIHPDGSAQTNSCEPNNPGCPCSSFIHCPAYASTLFRQFGFDDRISMFQVIDPQAKEVNKSEDPYDVPYLIVPGDRDSCYLTPSSIDMLWPARILGDKCLRGTLGKVSTNPSLYVCAPSQYVTGDTFDVEAYMRAYRT